MFLLFNDREFTARVDVQITSKDRIGAAISSSRTFRPAPLAGSRGRVVDIPARDQQIALDWVHTFNSALLNQVRYSFSRAGLGLRADRFPGCTQAAINTCPTGISFQNNTLSFGMQNNLPQGRIINNTQVQDNASYFRGGTPLIRWRVYKQRSPNVFLPQTNGTYTFADFNHFLQNAPVQLSLTDGTPKFNFKEYDIAAYAGDDWRVKDNLTINLGLRWEFSSQAINLLHNLTIANQAGSTPFWDPNARQT